MSFALGQELSAAGTTVSITTQTESETRPTWNVLAESATKAGKTVVVGAHLDSVVEGPGINDNGSGSSTILEIAEEMAADNAPANPVRLAFWGAEESGLLGSEHSVASLSAAELQKIGLNLNFDMLASPNFVRFVYDGDGSITPGDPDDGGPAGSGDIEQTFLRYFDSQGLATEPTEFDGRSDYGPFIDAGIPAGGLFSGAEGIKTLTEAATYGGVAGEAYDRGYHEACDTISNVNRVGLGQLADGAAHATAVYAYAKSGKGKGKGKAKPEGEHKGARLQR